MSPLSKFGYLRAACALSLAALLVKIGLSNGLFLFVLCLMGLGFLVAGVYFRWNQIRTENRIIAERAQAAKPVYINSSDNRPPPVVRENAPTNTQ